MDLKWLLFFAIIFIPLLIILVGIEFCEYCVRESDKQIERSKRKHEGLYSR